MQANEAQGIAQTLHKVCQLPDFYDVFECRNDGKNRRPFMRCSEDSEYMIF